MTNQLSQRENLRQIALMTIFQINSVLLGLVIREILQMESYNTSEMDKLRQVTKAYVVLLPLLGITWVFGILSITNVGLAFQYIFTILNSLQVHSVKQSYSHVYDNKIGNRSLPRSVQGIETWIPSTFHVPLIGFIKRF